MKKPVLSLFALLLAISFTSAQVSFSDDFESYSPGDLIAASSPNWITWSGLAAEDAPISSAQAYSGSNSLWLMNSNPGGGPVDILLPFGGTYTSGNFEVSMKLFVVGGTGAYFNLQAVQPAGVTWAVEFYLQPNGAMVVSNLQNGQLMVTEYSHNEWFDFRLEIDLTANNWRVFINDLLAGSFSNGVNSVASLNLFPFVQGGGSSSYYVDDVAYSHQPFVVPNLDAAITEVTMRQLGLTGQELQVTGELRNLGLTPITSAMLSYTVGANTVDQPLTGLNIPTLGSYQFSFTQPYTLAVGVQTITVTVFAPNGLADDNPDNDTKTSILTGYTPAPGKRVVIEEATGTWCGWCPRGTINMDRAADYYPEHFVGIAVHNGDPMAVPEYDNGITSFPGFTGFPSVIMDRLQIFDPSQIEANFLSRVTAPPVALLSNHATWNETTNELQVTVTADFQAAVSGNFRLSLVVTEDGVTGLGSGFNQVNFYAGGASGPMGGYENLPNPVPASQMVYDYVGRAVVGGFNGVAGSLPASIAAGETHSYTFSYTLPSEYDYNRIKLIGLLLNAQGRIDNASSTSIDEAIANAPVNTLEAAAQQPEVRIFPNPFSDVTSLQLNLPETAEVQLRVFSSTGALVATRQYGTLQGQWTLPFQAGELPNGMYFLQLQIGKQTQTHRISLIGH
jgi:hypothetical protein